MADRAFFDPHMSMADWIEVAGESEPLQRPSPDQLRNHFRRKEEKTDRLRLAPRDQAVDYMYAWRMGEIAEARPIGEYIEKMMAKLQDDDDGAPRPPAKQ